MFWRLLPLVPTVVALLSLLLGLVVEAGGGGPSPTPPCYPGEFGC